MTEKKEKGKMKYMKNEKEKQRLLFWWKTRKFEKVNHVANQGRQSWLLWSQKTFQSRQRKQRQPRRRPFKFEHTNWVDGQDNPQPANSVGLRQPSNLAKHPPTHSHILTISFMLKQQSVNGSLQHLFALKCDVIVGCGSKMLRCDRNTNRHRQAKRNMKWNNSNDKNKFENEEKERTIPGKRVCV